MKALFRSVVAGVLALVLTSGGAFAQERPAFSPEQLDQMLAPIALYPDSLLSQVLMAATYPLEVVQAARWSRANPNLKGQDAVRAVDSMDWDPSVKSLVAFPQILHRMDEQLEWTQRLGEAFLAQEPHVMDAIQGLRQRAERAGNLRSNEQMRVTRQDGNILIEPAQQQVVYVPYYDSAVVYGAWGWPAYPPYYWGPPPGYYAWPAYAPGWYWGPAIAFSWGFFFGHADWHHHHVTVVHAPPHHHPVHGSPGANPVKWQHDPVHRRNVPYRYTNWRQPSSQHPAMRGDDRAQPFTRNEPRGAPADTRGGAPQSRSPSAAPARPQSAAPMPRSERSTPWTGDRQPERTARTDGQRPQIRGPESRPAGSLPTVRGEPRPYSPAAHAQPVPRRESAPGARAETRAPMRDHFVMPHSAPGAPMHAPRFTGNHPGAAARAPGGGHAPAMAAGRGGGRS